MSSNQPIQRTILIIERDRSIRCLLADLLDGEGYGVLLAASEGEGARLARERGPDAILLDISPPAEPALGLLGRLRGDERTRLIPVVGLATLHPPAGDDADSGPESVLPKPFEVGDLLVHLERVTCVHNNGRWADRSGTHVAVQPPSTDSRGLPARPTPIPIGRARNR